MKTFISENGKKQKKTETKRAIIGPGQGKKSTPKSNDDILGLDLLGTGNTIQQQPHTNSSSSQQKLPQTLITFDQLLGNNSKSNSSQNKGLMMGGGGDLL